MKNLVKELRVVGNDWIAAAGNDSRWDHKTSFDRGVGHGLLHAARRIEEVLRSAEAQADDALRFSTEAAEARAELKARAGALLAMGGERKRSMYPWVEGEFELEGTK